MLPLPHERSPPTPKRIGEPPKPCLGVPLIPKLRKPPIPEPRYLIKPRLREPPKPSHLMKNNHQQVPSGNKTATSEEVNLSAVSCASETSTTLSKVMKFVLGLSTMMGSGKLKITISAPLIILKTK